ncbi:MAG: putative toxin-antitoxin system toxin component, PIN family [Deltaproteobacteria bacterium]|jgi:putative PIN family toxin of toxin-antitoxin system|nr:putative toxin-antitoxin system toxin component, PIN family [Deltaproteobacteria bacterium]
MAKVVIDANVMISAAFGGKPLEAVGRALKEHDVFVSTSILQELDEVLKRLSKKLSAEQIHYLQERLGQLIKVAHRIPISKHLSLSRDAKDDHYLSLCKEAQADFLITGDKDLLNLPPDALKKKGIFCQIINPASFLEIAP